MRASIIRIGNSRGIRLPKTVLDECGLVGEVELKVRRGQIVILPVSKARKGWDEAFQRMAERRDDRLLDREALPRSDWERAEWEW
ncbi:MAG: AbrB/MazE/SpoVT family DNA-binding domain-containing protein [Myxococcales bacterium]|nr:AbrB/MazE/SpoVT family DNA-binding domain-containing protein [Myxococcales bacterium]